MTNLTLRHQPRRRPRAHPSSGARAVWVALAFACAFGRVDAASAQQYLTESEALALAFPGADRVDERRAIATNEQRDEIARRAGIRDPERIFPYYEGRKDGGPMGYAVIDNVIGKHQPITYMIVFAPDLRVRRIEVLAYRESYGWEVRRESFLKQFYGRDPDAELRFGAEIQNISGATISVRSMIRAVREKQAYAAVLLPKAPAAAPSAPKSPATPKKPEKESGAAPDAPALRRFARAQLRMGTLLEIQVYAPDEVSSQAALDAAFDEVGRVEELLSTWIPTSAISRLNREGARHAVEVGEEAAALLTRAEAVRRRSAGAFDIAVGPLVDLWREASERGAPPSAEAIAAAARLRLRPVLM
ncbi:MAG: FAD:protein FMN transferase, partial [Myxococcales bacterium]|nr:FAD:protein FMN transferase [Myxococcales bacterium]